MPTDSTLADRDLIDGLTLIASRAAAAILAIPKSALMRRDKADRSPVTAADEASEAIILEGLGRLLPGVPAVSEEQTAHAQSAPAGSFFLVDPLDGTREFVDGLTEYTVSIALVQNGEPVVGVITAPALGQVWRGIVGRGAERLRLPPGAELGEARDRATIRTRTRPADRTIALVSRNYRDANTEAFLDRMAGVERQALGSSLKFCRLAEGTADIYPRLSNISEWDIAAGHALLVAAGGTIAAPDGRPLTYGRGAALVPGFIAVGDRALALRA